MGLYIGGIYFSDDFLERYSVPPEKLRSLFPPITLSHPSSASFMLGWLIYCNAVKIITDL